MLMTYFRSDSSSSRATVCLFALKQTQMDYFVNQLPPKHLARQEIDKNTWKSSVGSVPLGSHKPGLVEHACYPGVEGKAGRSEIQGHLQIFNQPWTP